MTIQIWVIGKYKVDAIADTALVSSSSRVCIGFSNKITPLPTLKAMWGHAGTGIFAHSLGLWINSVPTVDFDEVVKRMPQALLTINTLIGTSLDRDEGAYVDESGVMAGWSEKSKAMVGYKYLIKGDDIKFEQTSYFANPDFPDAHLLLKITPKKMEHELSDLAETLSKQANIEHTFCSGGQKMYATLTKSEINIRNIGRMYNDADLQNAMNFDLDASFDIAMSFVIQEFFYEP